MATNVLQFQKNWNNKLAADSFLVITKPSRKYTVGRNYAVYLGQQRLGTAELTAIRRFKLDELSNISALMVTGYQAFQAKKLLKTQFYGHLKTEGPEACFYFLAFQYVTQNQDMFRNRPQIPSNAE